MIVSNREAKEPPLKRGKTTSYMGLTIPQIKEIKAFWQSQKDLVTVPTHFRKPNGLPRSVVIIPGKGCFVLCKTKGDEPWVAIGSVARATLAFNIDTSEQVVFRSAKAKHITPNEVIAHQKFPNDSYFIKADSVSYRGPWKSRGLDSGKDENDVAKIGMLMPFIPQGKLEDAIKKKSLNSEQKLAIVIGLVKAHLESKKAKLVNFDFSQYNILLDEQLLPKIIDFGAVFEVGRVMRQMRAPPGFNSPEIVDCHYNKEEILAHPSAEIWNIGIIMALLTSRSVFFDCIALEKNGLQLPISEDAINAMLFRHFPQLQNNESIDYIIVRCLRYKAEERIKGEELLEWLERFLSNPVRKDFMLMKK